ncbi:MAG: glycosyltransferase family 39 protein [Pseudomonadota bacterium]|nr:glycosyltransferase family 39 protein [Pseudomonadota bacterium]
MTTTENPTGLRLLCAVLLPLGCLWGLGSYGLLDNNEGLYASVALDMLHGGTLIIPHLNGVPYLEKPPLLYWLTALSMRALGENEFAARLPVALSTLLLALAMMRFLTKHAGGRAGTIAGLVVATSPVILVIGRTVYCDMLMTAALSIALMAFYLWYAAGCRRWLVFCYAMVGAAVMAKGIVAAALAGGTGLLFLLLENNGKRFVQALDPLAIAAFLLIVAPWHIAAALQDKNFLWFYFINEHVLRFLGNRQPHDYYHGPVWYYLIRLPLYLFPWAIAWLPLWGHRMQWHGPAPAGEALLKRFLWTWFLFIFIFFSLSRAKANYYMVAGMPPLVMLTALHIDLAVRHRQWHSLWRGGLAALAATSAFIIATPWISHIKPRDTGALTGILASLVFHRDILLPVCVLSLGLFVCWRWRRSPDAALLLFCIPAGVLLPLLLTVAQLGEPVISQKPTILFLKAHAPTESIAVYRDFEEISSLAFYAGRPLAIVDSASNDLAYGREHGQRPDLFPTLPQWLARPPGHGGALIVRHYYLRDLQRRLATLSAPPLCLVKQYQMVSIFKRC